MAVHQILVGASVGDAITQLALRYRSALRERVESDVFALHVDSDAEGLVKRLPEYERTARGGDDLLVFHASIGDPRVFEFLMRRPEPVLVVYHNISPAGPYRRFAPEFAELLARGRDELEALRPRVVASITDSAFNASELEMLGYEDIEVLAPAVEVESLRQTPPDRSTQRHLQTVVEGPVLLFVGQLLPHKRIEELLLAYHVLVTYLASDAHLFLVGSKRLTSYVATVEELQRTLGLGAASMIGRVDVDQLAAFYERADLFVTLSEHEGFCIPLLEAMSFDVPILACDAAAVPETLGDAGVLLPQDASPTLTAEAMAELLENDPLRAELTGRGRTRIADFELTCLVREFVEFVLKAAR